MAGDRRGDERGHSNPVDESDVTDDERAVMLREYLDAFAEEFGHTQKLMPLGEDGKGPAVRGMGRGALDDPERGGSLLVDADKAVRRIREDGARGFCIYAGKADHGTADVVFVDHDDLDAFPTPTADPTLEVLSGSGRGRHETYRNAGDVERARVGDGLGEIRAKNWYVVAPGSIHPSGGVYHVTEERHIATLADADLDDDARPASVTNGGTATATASSTKATGTVVSPVEYEPGEDAPTAEAVLEAEPWIGDYLDNGAEDRSSKDFAVCRTMAEYGVPETEARTLLESSPRTKASERGDRYWRRTWTSAISQADVGSKRLDVDGSGGIELPDVSGGEQQGDTSPNQRDLQARCRAAITDAIEDGERVVIDAIPSLGKSRAATESPAETGIPVTLLTHLKDNRTQLRNWALGRGLRPHILPVFDDDCPTAAGTHGEDEQRRVHALRDAGVRPKEIHKQIPSLPCQSEGKCPYVSRWDFPEDEKDLIIGWPGHAQMGRLTSDRAVVIDENPGEAFEDRITDGRLRRAVNAWLDHRGGRLPADVDALLSLRGNGRRENVLSSIASRYDDLRDPGAVFEKQGTRADAPALAYGLLAAEDLGNGFERAELPDGSVFVRDRADGSATIRRPPDLDDAHTVVGLDGTPTLRVWRGRLGLNQLEERRVMTDDERQVYLGDVLGNRYIQTTTATRPSAGGNIPLDRAVALLQAVKEHHSEAAALITSKQARMLLIDRGDGPAADHVDATMHFGNLRGSNAFKDRTLGAVVGTIHPGDDEIKRLAALDGLAVEATREEREDGTNRPADYGPAGNEYRDYFTENTVAQAALRFGRDEATGDAVVYIETSTVPGWLPVEKADDALRERSPGERRVKKAVEEVGQAPSSEIAERADLSKRQVQDHLRRLQDEGGVAKTAEAGPSVEWADRGLSSFGNQYAVGDFQTTTEARWTACDE